MKKALIIIAIISGALVILGVALGLCIGLSLMNGADAGEDLYIDGSNLGALVMIFTTVFSAFYAGIPIAIAIAFVFAIWCVFGIVCLIRYFVMRRRRSE